MVALQVGFSSTTDENASETPWVDELNEVSLKPRFNKSLDLKMSFLVGYFKKINTFLVYSVHFHKTVYNKWCLDETAGQIENVLERGFVC